MQHKEDSDINETNDNQSYQEFTQFDEILSYIGFKKYQIYVFIIVGLIGMCDGGETQAISIVFPILEKEWNVSDSQKSLLGSLIYIGYFIGSLFSGVFADNYGRRSSLLWSSGIMFMCAIIGAFMPNFISYMIFRILLVTCVGFIIPVSFSMLAENTPLKSRGIVLVTIGFFYTAGELTVCLLTYIFMPNLVSGNWRAVLCWASAPALLTLLISNFLLLESPRYHLIKGNVSEASKVINKIFRLNNKVPVLIPINTYQNISQDLIKQEKEEQGLQEDLKDKSFLMSYFIQFKKLLKNQFVRITLIVWYQWFVNTFVYAGVTFLLPLTLQKLNPDEPQQDDIEDLTVITLSCLGEIPVIFVAMIIVNIRIFGRKNSLFLSYFGVGLVGLLIAFIAKGGYFFASMIFFLKMFISFSFTVSYQFVSELYPTYMRASGLGFASSVGRLGSIIMPWIVVYINDIGTFLSYGIFGVIAILASIATLLLPFDTYLRELDKIVTKQ
ncbi:unnamed protein product [Paramecium sonneborni]|uniref:Major facilitator superfamily (MFS) profile domain-containing protein n=1 Tax=Paramecium sonneborni TaxID=65129 RepID=A0A8S1M832_9CILI|nr:unnamed protein product [Paramecium sonneborni]